MYFLQEHWCTYVPPYSRKEISRLIKIHKQLKREDKRWKKVKGEKRKQNEDKDKIELRMRLKTHSLMVSTFHTNMGDRISTTTWPQVLTLRISGNLAYIWQQNRRGPHAGRPPGEQRVMKVHTGTSPAVCWVFNSPMPKRHYRLSLKNTNESQAYRIQELWKCSSKNFQNVNHKSPKANSLEKGTAAFGLQVTIFCSSIKVDQIRKHKLCVSFCFNDNGR